MSLVLVCVWASTDPWWLDDSAACLIPKQSNRDLGSPAPSPTGAGPLASQHLPNEQHSVVHQVGGATPRRVIDAALVVTEGALGGVVADDYGAGQ